MRKFTATLLAAVMTLTPIVTSASQAAGLSAATHASGHVALSRALATGSIAPASDHNAPTSGLGQDNLVDVQYRNGYYQDRRGFNPRGYKQHRYDRKRYDHRRNYQPHRDQRRSSRSPDLGSAVVGAIIGGIIVNEFNRPQQRQTRARSGNYLSQNHVNWCHNRWRSYRVSDNSYQPYNGPRRICASPYGPS